MTQQALELRIEISVVANAFEIVLLRHPLDSQDDECHTKRTVREDSLSDFFCRSNRFAVSHEACFELFRELFEQVNVLGLFACELQERTSAIVVFIQVRSDVVENEGQNELLDEAEGVEIAVATNLIEHDLLLFVKKIERFNSRERLGHERFGEIQALVAADNVFNSPVRLYRCCQSFLIVVISCEHGVLRWVCRFHIIAALPRYN